MRGARGNAVGILGHQDKAFAMTAYSGGHSLCYKDDGSGSEKEGITVTALLHRMDAR